MSISISISKRIGGEGARSLLDLDLDLQENHNLASTAANDEAPTLVVPTIDETLTLLRCSVPDPDPSIPGSTEETLERKLQVLLGQSGVLLQHKQNLKEAVTKFEIQIQQIHNRMVELQRLSLFPDALVHFVSLLEVANQYFEFIESAKQVYDFEPSYSSMDIERTLLLDQQLTSKFNKLGKREISEAAQAIFWELYAEQHGKKHVNQDRLDWIYKLVYKARVKGYVMDQDPSAELEKMMKFEPVVYDRYFLIQQLPVKSTKKLTEEAHNKYSQLVTTIHAKYKEPFNEKLTSTATSARNIEEAINDMHKFTPIFTGAGNKEAFSEKHKFTSTATSARNKETFECVEKRKLIATATSARYKETLGEKQKLTSSEAFVGSDRNEENDKYRLISTRNAKRPFVMTGGTGKVAKAKVMFSDQQNRDLPRVNAWAPVPPQAYLGHSIRPGLLGYTENPYLGGQMHRGHGCAGRDNY